MRSPLTIFTCLAALAAPLMAVDARSIEIDYTEHVITITRTNGTAKSFDWTDRLPLDEADRAFAEAELQGLYDNLLHQNQLPADDPDRLADPNTDCAHWADARGNRDTGGNRIMYRGTLVVVTLDGDGPVLELQECR